MCCAYYIAERVIEVKPEVHSSDYTEHPHDDKPNLSLSSTKNSLKDHQKQHTGEKCYPCTECEKCYSTRNALYSHRNIHKGKFRCTECGRCCSSKTYLAEHRQRHLGLKTLECMVCSKLFTTSWELSMHVKTHSGEKQYKCYVCDKLFGQRGHLKVHMRVHTGEKPYECLVCNRSFMWSGGLWQHKRSAHSNKSKRSEELKQDKKKPFKCSMCDKGFTKSCHRNDHMRIHTGEKPYNCSLCNKSFTTSSHLKSHKRRMHNSGTDTQNIKSEYVCEDWSAKEKEENLAVVKQDHDDVSYV